MKKYKVSGSNLKILISKVAEKLNIPIERVGYNILNEDKSSGKVELEVWAIEEELKSSEKAEEIEIDITKEGVFLCINGDVDFNKLIDYIAERDIESPEIDKITEAYDNKGKKIKIAEFYEGVYKEAEINITIAEDKMKAFLVIGHAKGMNLPGVNVIKEKLKEAGVVFGIKDELIKEALNSKKFNTEIVVAEGKNPIDGKSAEMRYFIKVMDKKSMLKPALNEDGSVDFKTLEILENVSKGQILAEKIPPKKGEPGKNIFGQELSAKDGKDIPSPAGKNTEWDEETKSKILSKIDGMVTIKEKKIFVSEIFVTPTVGITTGNIKFVGGVIVRGDIESGYVVEAEGNIEVKGNVEKAHLISGGDIIVKGSTFGKGEGRFEAKNDVILNFAESINIEAEGNVVVNEGIMGSNITVGKKLRVIDKKGVIIGGEIKAGEGVEAINIGSHLAVKTEIEVGSNPKVLEELKKLEIELEETDKKMGQVEKNLVLLQKIKSNLKENFPEDKKEMLNQLIKAKYSMTKNINEIKLRIEELQLAFEEVKNSTVDVFGTCYPGVKIKIRKGAYFVKEKIQNVRFYYENGDVRITALK